MIKIGTYKLPGKIIMAPLSGCTDLAFRLMARRYGAKLCFLEMADANSLVHQDVGITEFFKTNREDQPLAAQLVGGEPAAMVEALQRLLTLVKPAFIDINAACPVRKMVGKKAGSYLIFEPARLYRIVEGVVAASSLPVTVKLRTGFERRDRRHLLTIARNLAKRGVAAIFIHGRTRGQGYSGEVDYAAIKAVKEAVTIPVFGSGNIFSPELAKKMFDLTGCDGITVARGALGHPWIFRRIEHYLKDGKLSLEPSSRAKMTALKEHLALLAEHRRTSQLGWMRKVAIWYLKGFPDACEWRNRFGRAKSYEEMLGLIDEQQEKHQADPAEKE
ncbi:MAG: tRNA dihydrouridine synthase DusB [Candidatus Margulisiibacteriota bacterium]